MTTWLIGDRARHKDTGEVHTVIGLYALPWDLVMTPDCPYRDCDTCECRPGRGSYVHAHPDRYERVPDDGLLEAVRATQARPAADLPSPLVGRLSSADARALSGHRITITTNAATMQNGPYYAVFIPGRPMLPLFRDRPTVAALRAGGRPDAWVYLGEFATVTIHQTGRGHERRRATACGLAPTTPEQHRITLRDRELLRVFGRDLAAQITHMDGVCDVTEAPDDHGASKAHRLSLLVDLGHDDPVRVDLSLAGPGHGQPSQHHTQDRGR